MRRALEDHDLGPGVGVDIFEGDDEEDVDELVPVRRQETNRQSSFPMGFVLFMIWFVWGEELLLAWVFGFLSTGEPGFLSKFVLEKLKSEFEGWIFIIASLVVAFVALRKTWVVGSRDADFSLCRLDISDYNTDLLNLGSHREYLLEHIDNFHEPELRPRYTQLFAPHPILALISEKIDRKEEFRLALQERYFKSSHRGYWALVSFNVLVHTVSMNGLIGFCILTPNAILGEYYKIPFWVFMSVASFGAVVGLRQGYKLIKAEMAKYESEKDLPSQLLALEIENRSKLQQCNESLHRLNRLIQPGVRQGVAMAPLPWTPVRPYLPLEEWLKKREAGATFQSVGYFTSGGATLFPRRVKAPLLLTRRAAQAYTQEEERHEGGNDFDL